MNDPILDKLKAYFENTPREQVEKDWKKLSMWGEVGQPVTEFLNENIMNKWGGKYNGQMVVFFRA